MTRFSLMKNRILRIAAAMTHSLSFFAALCWGAPMGGYLGMASPKDSLGRRKILRV
jgi:hypothetical protein